ncbi:MAG: sulfatase-like hydrolase/transferase [Candidatus Hydrogenedens sp.]|nr:sulfatase-like hydrolase/transferase [Candidatus Hydrogenedens sp.]
MASACKYMMTFAACIAALSSWSEEPPPNIVLLIGDDQAWNDYGFMGHEAIQTPHLDALAAEGIVYSHGYVVTSLCRPSLATMATGLYPHQHGITGNDPKGPRPKRAALDLPWRTKFETLPRVAELLGEKKGYVSHQSGKWWEGPCMCGGFTAGMTHGDPERGGRHGDAGLLIGRETMQPVFDFIDEAGAKPFFIWYAPFLPHEPHNPPDRLLKKYEAAGRPEELAKYYAMCEWFDETVGQLVSHIEKRGLSDRTMYVFLADNGWIQPTPNRPPAARPSQGAPRGKGSPYEGGIRTPFLVQWPGHTEHKVVDTPVSSIDIAPTILRAAGLEVPAELPGLDLLDLQAVDARPAVYGAIFEHDMASPQEPGATLQWRWMVRGNDKIIAPTGRVEGQTEVFNLAADPWEEHDIAAESPDKTEELTAELNAWWTP